MIELRKTRLGILLIILMALSCRFCIAEESSVSPKRSAPVPTEGIIIPVFAEGDLPVYEIPDNEAMRFVKQLKVGWNLGNTFDAHPNNNFRRGLELETLWCGARTTRELIVALREAGFSLIRIPVSWHNHIIDDQNTIDPKWMNRVREVAQWICEEGMYCIVNVHHDNWKYCFYPDTEHYEQSEKYLTAVWKQIADAFSDFDDHCLLESMNEPRLVGTSYEWNFSGSSKECKDAMDCINRLNQKFVDTVRASGEKNSTRYLLVPGYDAGADGVLNAGFILPEDTAENKLIVSVHAYTPYNFAQNTKSPDNQFEWTSRRMQSSVTGFMTKLYNKYVANGIPVLIDEFGALKKQNDNLQARVNYAAFYVASASARGMTCCWWDNNAFTGSGECFGLINRNRLEWIYPDIALAMVQNCWYGRNPE